MYRTDGTLEFLKIFKKFSIIREEIRTNNGGSYEGNKGGITVNIF